MAGITKAERERRKAEQAAEEFKRQTWCWICDVDKDSFMFRGVITYYCPVHTDFIRQRDATHGGHWRRKGEQEQN